MRITKALKMNLKKAQAQGKKRVYSIGGAYKATTYCTFWRIEYLLSLQNGTMLRAGKATDFGGWKGATNTRQVSDEDISYSDLWG